jgi:hypothetical protein
MQIRYRTLHWGGTDHEELRDPHQRRGRVLQLFGKSLQSLSIPTQSLAILPIQSLPEVFV